MGNYPECQHCPITDYLWHDVVLSLPELGNVIKIDDNLFQIEGVRLDNLWIDEEDKDTYIIDVRPYRGEIEPVLTYTYSSAMSEFEY
ncbi:hypothetical protein [Aliterella atlantica]|uniref:hypothetical protein n=1 Tax=Aliterella atlantica TaxID=1827278 RepID=UPI0011851104|nr:hypothetical protein [Aliterella atlantica]